MLQYGYTIEGDLWAITKWYWHVCWVRKILSFIASDIFSDVSYLSNDFPYLPLLFPHRWIRRGILCLTIFSFSWNLPKTIRERQKRSKGLSYGGSCRHGVNLLEDMNFPTLSPHGCSTANIILQECFYWARAARLVGDPLEEKYVVVFLDILLRSGSCGTIVFNACTPRFLPLLFVSIYLIRGGWTFLYTSITAVCGKCASVFTFCVPIHHRPSLHEPYITVWSSTSP